MNRTRNGILLGGVLLALLPGAGRAADGAAPEVEVVGVERKAGVTVTDVKFGSSAGNPPIQAYVVRPESGAGPVAGVLFVHWYAPKFPTSNRTQFLKEAEALARKGTVSLLVSTFWSDPERYKGRRWQDDYQNSLNQTADLRRALDVLLAQPGVDSKRIGYVGHDYGAMFGAVVASMDERPKAYALIAGTARFSDWYVYGSGSGVPEGDDLARFKAQLAPIEPVNVIGKSKSAFFFQFGEQDGFTPREDFVAFYLAAPETKRIATYASDHSMSSDVIRFDRDLWLAEHLGLAVPSLPE